jgi:uncharacterized protein YecE (DUF72 family)
MSFAGVGSATKRARVPELRIGCSGWNYAHWRRRFYPDSPPISQWLRYYVERFDTVEANSTFYRLPTAETFDAWRRATPVGFLMAVKASRYLTHLKRLRDPDEPLQRFFDRASALGPRLGPVLYQLPGYFHRDPSRLASFLTRVPARVPAGTRTRRLRHVMEFRHPSWYEPDTYALLAAHGVALCLHDKDGSAIALQVPGPFLYVRFHGATGRYHGSYGDAALDRWADRLASEWLSGNDVFAYFNNDPDAAAIGDAVRLRDRVLALTGHQRS